MTYSDIRTKFEIEYDKDAITSSYPSLTRTEQSTFLDKAYYALLQQKLTGNNPRKVEFEGDNKAIEDIRPLIITDYVNKNQERVYVQNDAVYKLPNDFLYYISGRMLVGITVNEDTTYNITTMNLVTHDVAEKFMCTSTNKPWVATPVCYMEDDKLIALVDPVLHVPGKILLTYVKQFHKFIDCTNEIQDKTTEFELSDSMAEELINLAIIFAAENVESPRTNSKLNLRPLES